MAKLLDEYYQKQGEIQKKIKAGTLPMEELFHMQELAYRISILETMQTFVRVAGSINDLEKCGKHYQVFKSFIRQTMSEHKVCINPNDEMREKRDAAARNLEKVLEDGLGRFKRFNKSEVHMYKDMISKLVQTYLSVWIAYRNTYVAL